MFSFLFLGCVVPMVSGCGDSSAPTSVTEGMAPSAIEEYQAKEKQLLEETENSMKDNK
ncbi:hypothetical protein Poly51_23100 [Rubripirellula tenax]|uniref:Uncharacterized protein n=2 Tax=Rubripirellula tenax TaxID=2528015 RepID=A0A5C6F733_9BACT|nr:hypothetical protein Poly51_23100 [Rubripirellula tenax]